MGQIKHVCLPLKQVFNFCLWFLTLASCLKTSVELFKTIDTRHLLPPSLMGWPRRHFLFSSRLLKQVWNALRAKTPGKY